MRERARARPTPPEKRKPNDLHHALKTGQTPVQARAAMAVEGLATNTLTVRQWSAQIFGEEGLDLTAAVEAVVDTSTRVRDGNLGQLEMLLASQIIAMNAIFANLASRARQATYLDHFDKYMRLALKAQGQCRATAESLALMKNPPVFARQANIASGPQQVNNGPVLNTTPARADDSASGPNKLLGAPDDGKRMVGDATETASGRHPPMEAVAAIDWSEDTRGKEPRVAERVARR
jgi:hypothetical protein